MAGRPSKYNSKYHPLIAESLAKLGLVAEDIAAKMGISKRTLHNWQARYPEFAEALEAGREYPDEQVERAIFLRATGYEAPETKVFLHNGEIVTRDIIKHHPPDPTSMIFWLKNRRPDRWRDKQEVHTTSDTIEIGLPPKEYPDEG